MQDLNIQKQFVGKKLEEVDFFDILNVQEQEVDSFQQDDDKDNQEMMSESESDTKMKKSKPVKNKQKQRWTAEEEEELKKYFEKKFVTKRTPRMAEVQKAKKESFKAGGALHKRHWHIIVKKVSAMIIKEKRKQNHQSSS